MRKLATALTLALALLTSTAAHATKIPLGATPEAGFLTVNAQLQTWVSALHRGALDGDNPLYDMRLRRARLVVTGDPTDKWSFLVQLDSPNWGAGGNWTPGFIVQDFWGSYAFTGRTGGTVIMLDAGMLLLPLSRQFLQSTTSFTTIDVHLDAERGFRETPGVRDLGLSVRGWALDKKLGFRGGIYRGAVGTAGDFSATNPRAGLNPHSAPRYALFLNYNILGTEEGSWLYNSIYFTDKPIVSVGGAATYQSRATRGALGQPTDARLLSGHVFADIPTLPDHEAILHGTYYRNDFGGGVKDTGNGFFVDAGYRVGFLFPYVSYEFFDADECPADVPAAACTSNTANSSIWKGGLGFYINKNANHVKIEFSSGRSLKAENGPITRSVLAQWNYVF